MYNILILKNFSQLQTGEFVSFGRFEHQKFYLTCYNECKFQAAYRFTWLCKLLQIGSMRKSSNILNRKKSSSNIFVPQIKFSSFQFSLKNSRIISVSKNRWRHWVECSNKSCVWEVRSSAAWALGQSPFTLAWVEYDRTIKLQKSGLALILKANGRHHQHRSVAIRSGSNIFRQCCSRLFQKYLHFCNENPYC